MRCRPLGDTYGLNSILITLGRRRECTYFFLLSFSLQVCALRTDEDGLRLIVPHVNAR